MNRVILSVVTALVFACGTATVSADEVNDHGALLRRMADEGMLGAPGTVHVAYGQIGDLPERFNVPAGMDVVGTIAELPTGPNAFGGAIGARYNVYLTAHITPKDAFTAIAAQFVSAGYRAVVLRNGVADTGFLIVPRSGATLCRRDRDPSVFVRAWSDGNDRTITDVFVEESPQAEGVPNTCASVSRAPAAASPTLPAIVSSDAIAIISRVAPPSSPGISEQYATVRTAASLQNVVDAWSTQMVSDGWAESDVNVTREIALASFRMQINGHAAVTYLTISRLAPDTMFAQERTVWERPLKP